MFRPRPTFALALILAPLLPKAQTFFYIDQVTVQPGSPTEQDAVEITLSGGLSSTRAHIVSTTYQLAGNTVLITVDAADNGGLTVIVPHNETIAIGSLSAGNWDIEIQGQHVLDLAPQPQHTFQVSGGAQNPCDSLQLVALRYAAFTDTALVAGLHNLGASFFNYPGLLLRNTGGDTLAIETVDLFGLVGESWHWLPIHPSSVLPAAPFPATLEVWVNFFDSLACAFPVVVEPCPPDPCTEFHPALYNAGGAMALGTFNWTVLDDNGPVANGLFELTNMQQFTMDTLCLPPGNYQMTVTANQPPSGGWPVFTVIDAIGGFSGPEQEVQTAMPVLMPFTFYGACIDGTNSLEETAEYPVRIIMGEQGPILRSLDGIPLGVVEILDVTGRLLERLMVTTDRMTIATSALAHGIALVRVRGLTMRTLLGGAFPR